MSKQIITDVEALVTEYKSGASASELAKKYSTSTHVITDTLKRNGVQLRSLSETAKLKIAKYGHPSLGRTHSESTRQKMRENHANFKGANHPQYKGVGEYAVDGAYLNKDGNGYLRRTFPGHPLSDPTSNLIGEHVFQACIYYGIDVVKGNEVHHINGNKSDNRIENLQVLSKSEHRRLENNLRAGTA